MNLVDNRKAFYDYEITDRIEAGISLVGSEVKALKSGKASLVGSYIIVRGNEAFLTGATIQPYQQKNTSTNYNPTRARKLLLSKKQISQLIGVEKERGLTAIPLNAHLSRNLIKIEIGIARSKKKHDKRQKIKKREDTRTIEREIKRIR
ncbi:MAG: SsrA-binding protein SmpB [bacterium]|nr:SsrA-binding protein SmpB [bacterium]